MSTKAANEDDEPIKKRRRDNKTQTVNTNGTLDEAMTSTLASSSDDEAEETHAAKKIAIENIERYHKEKTVIGTSQDNL